MGRARRKDGIGNLDERRLSKNTDDGMKTGNRKQRVGERAYGASGEWFSLHEKIIFPLLRIRGIINCFLGVTLISNYSALFCIIIITENADKHMEFLDFCCYCDLLDTILEYSK